MEKANTQKQQYGSPSLQSSLRCHTLAFFAARRTQKILSLFFGFGILKLITILFFFQNKEIRDSI